MCPHVSWFRFTFHVILSFSLRLLYGSTQARTRVTVVEHKLTFHLWYRHAFFNLCVRFHTHFLVCINCFSQHSLPSSGLIANGMDPERCHVNTIRVLWYVLYTRMSTECAWHVDMFCCTKWWLFFNVSTGGYLNKYYITTCSYVNVYS